MSQHKFGAKGTALCCKPHYHAAQANHTKYRAPEAVNNVLPSSTLRRIIFRINTCALAPKGVVQDIISEKSIYGTGTDHSKYYALEAINLLKRQISMSMLQGY